MKKRQIRLLGTSLMIGLMVMVSPIKAQNPNPDELAGKDVTKNYISTAMPILLIAPDARSGGMGDVGVASTPDARWYNIWCCMV